MLQHYYKAYLSHNYLSTPKVSLYIEQVIALCRKDERLGLCKGLTPQLLMQLGAGSFTTRNEFAHVVSHLNDNVDNNVKSFISGDRYNGMA
jgi:hypothetical protein